MPVGTSATMRRGGCGMFCFRRPPRAVFADRRAGGQWQRRNQPDRQTDDGGQQQWRHHQLAAVQHRRRQCRSLRAALGLERRAEPGAGQRPQRHPRQPHIERQSLAGESRRHPGRAGRAHRYRRLRCQHHECDQCRLPRQPDAVRDRPGRCRQRGESGHDHHAHGRQRLSDRQQCQQRRHHHHAQGRDDTGRRQQGRTDRQRLARRQGRDHRR